MHFSVAILLLLCGNAIVSARNCTDFPTVPNAQPLNRRDTYEKGDTVRFVCDTGYVGRQIKYTCSDDGWITGLKEFCKLRPCVLPDDITNGYYQMIKGDDFVFGTILKYFCDDGYQMASKEDTRTCLVSGWSNHLPICEPLSCDPPSPAPGVSVVGLPSEEEPILPDRFLTFSCDSPGSTLNGSATLVCGKDGKWDNPFPNCVEKSCALPGPNHKRRVVGAEGGRVAAGGQVTVQCVGGSSKQLQCLSSGEWSAPFPTCSDSCDVEHVSDSVVFSPAGMRKLQIGAHLRFRCKNQRHMLQGPEQITCLPDGQWSHKFPSCNDPQSCGAPPSLENGDFFAPSGPLGHNTRVQYLCQAKYTMEGGPHKTCLNGVWTGEIKCLKPCTVNPDLMEPNKIGFRYGREVKLYAPHNDHITFDCVDGATPDGKLAMRQICTDGVMLLPKCV